MGKFEPGSSYFAFTDDDWGFLNSISGFSGLVTTPVVEYTINGTKYHLVIMSDLLEDESTLENLEIDLYGFNVAVFTDSVQANVYGPGEW